MRTITLLLICILSACGSEGPKPAVSGAQSLPDHVFYPTDGTSLTQSETLGVSDMALSIVTSVSLTNQVASIRLRLYDPANGEIELTGSDTLTVENGEFRSEFVKATFAGILDHGTGVYTAEIPVTAPQQKLIVRLDRGSSLLYDSTVSMPDAFFTLTSPTDNENHSIDDTIELSWGFKDKAGDIHTPSEVLESSEELHKLYDIHFTTTCYGSYYAENILVPASLLGYSQIGSSWSVPLADILTLPLEQQCRLKISPFMFFHLPIETEVNVEFSNRYNETMPHPIYSIATFQDSGEIFINVTN